jgi:hypothetical protein
MTPIQRRGRCLTYPIQRIAHVLPILCSVRVLLAQVPFGQTLSLHSFRHRCTGVVRKLRRYYRSVRLPVFVRHWIMSLDFPLRLSCLPERKHGISRFSRRLFLYMLRVSDRAGFGCVSLVRRTRCGLPHNSTVSAPWISFISRLYTSPAHAFVNASRLALRPSSHDSRSVWFALPLLYDSFIRNNLPVYPGAI